MYFVRTPYIIKKLFPDILWEMPEVNNKIYLTFDDGPHPEMTPWILNYLKIHDAKATFFCLGKNAEKYPGLVQQIKDYGHTVGSHGYAHLNGWATGNAAYLKDVEMAEQVLSDKNNTRLFRPPYGRIRLSQLRQISARVVNWSLMPGDFDAGISSEKCHQRLSENVRSGDIICLHDSEQAARHLRYCLPKWLAFFDNKGLKSEALPLNP